MSDTDRKEGLYGPSGWTAEKGINACLIPLNTSSYATSDFFSFGGAGPAQAQFLLDALPQKNLYDRQNDGPILKEILTTCLKYPGIVTFEGYVVGKLRWDERVSVDGFTVQASAVCQTAVEKPSNIDEVWTLVRRFFDFTTSESPDDLAIVPMPDPLTHGEESIRLGWWLWWD